MNQTIAVLASNIKKNVQQVIVGKDDVIELMLTALIARGHVLLEDVPGTGKTVLAKTMARSIDCNFARIQFTPDLLPSDITGLSIFNQKKGEFEYKPGPIFTNLLLADEINRATPRTQSALLEAMEERQVTSDGVTRRMEEPFLVLATQNPVEIQGTFPLPEAQLDRFLLRLKMGYPNAAEAMHILDRFISNDPFVDLTPVSKKEDILEAQRTFTSIFVSEPVRQYMVALVEKTRVMENVALGVSPRGMLALLRSSQALAAIRGRDFVTPDDVKFLAVPIFAHRIIVRGAYGKSNQAEQLVNDVMSQVPVPSETPERA